jgi:hypothetical protein
MRHCLALVSLTMLRADAHPLWARHEQQAMDSARFLAAASAA